MTINLGTPKPTELKPRITVIGVGGAGGNAINNMIASNLEGVEFVACNTDAQALSLSSATRKVQLGVNLTQGLGSGSKPEVGRAAASEARDEILNHLEGSHMAFVTAGMGGGTGTGAAPVIAQLARDAGVLTVGVVTKPFEFEGAHRMAIAEAGIAELQNYVDTLLIIPNQNLFRVANERTTFADAFKMADDVLHAGVRGVTDLMVMPGLINLDFADVKAVMEEMGKAMMGTGEAEGDKRAIEAAEAAISNPLLEDTSMKGARGVLINITGGADMTLFEVDEAVKRIKDEVAENANIIFGSTFDDRMEGRMRISIVATGIDVAADVRDRVPKLQVVSAVGGGRGGFGGEPMREMPARDVASRTALGAEPAFGGAARYARDNAAVRSRAYDSGAATAVPRQQEPMSAVRSAPDPVAQRILAEVEARRAMPESELRQPEPPRMAAPPVSGRATQQNAAPQLKTVTSAKLDADHFIPQPPVEWMPSTTARRPTDPFAEAAVINGAAPRRQEGRSLLERMTGLTRGRGDPAKTEEPAKATAATSRFSSLRARTSPSAPAAERHVAETEAERPSDRILEGPAVAAAEQKRETLQQLKVEVPPRSATAEWEDDLLEIPAFLRRQTNG